MCLSSKGSHLGGQTLSLEHLKTGFLQSFESSKQVCKFWGPVSKLGDKEIKLKLSFGIIILLGQNKFLSLLCYFVSLLKVVSHILLFLSPLCHFELEWKWLGRITEYVLKFMCQTLYKPFKKQKSIVNSFQLNQQHLVGFSPQELQDFKALCFC